VKTIGLRLGRTSGIWGYGRRWGCVFTRHPLTIYPPFRTTPEISRGVPVVSSECGLSAQLSFYASTLLRVFVKLRLEASPVTEGVTHPTAVFSPLRCSCTSLSHDGPASHTTTPPHPC
jgi:hypothetical protein